jgi:hypothetical protein
MGIQAEASPAQITIHTRGDHIVIQFQADDETGYIEIETEGSVFFRTREGDEHYLEWDSLTEDMQGVLQRFVEDAEVAFDEAINALKDIPKNAGLEEDLED